MPYRYIKTKEDRPKYINPEAAQAHVRTLGKWILKATSHCANHEWAALSETLLDIESEAGTTGYEIKQRLNGEQPVNGFLGETTRGSK